LSDERPDALLKGALEKIIYFEARSEQLSNDLATALAETERLKSDVSEAAEREISLRRQLAEHEVQVSRLGREREELSRRVEALRGERNNLIGRLIEAQQLYAAGRGDEVEGSFDLAGFIAELRSEALAPRAVTAPVAMASPGLEAAVVSMLEEEAMPALALATLGREPSSQSAVARHAERLFQEGRLHVSEQQLLDLSIESVFPGHTEETLFGFSLRELTSSDGVARARAAERLEALGNPAAGPALSTALGAEPDPSVQVKLLNALVSFGRPDSVHVVSPHLTSPSPEVRIAALKAMLKLDASRATPHLATAMKDPDRAVRRRASLLALSLPSKDALALGQQAVADADPDVRSLGALALGATGGEAARPLLLKALRDGDAKVRQAAAQSLSRLLGEDVSGVAALDDVQLRREVRRLSTLPLKPPVKSPVKPPGASASKALEPPVSAPRADRPPVASAQPTPAPVSVSVPAVRPTSATARVSAAMARLPPPVVSETLCTALMEEIRCTLRGRTLADLSAQSRETPSTVEQACELLIARGQVLRRGQKYFAA